MDNDLVDYRTAWDEAWRFMGYPLRTGHPRNFPSDKFSRGWWYRFLTVYEGREAANEWFRDHTPKSKEGDSDE